MWYDNWNFRQRFKEAYRHQVDTVLHANWNPNDVLLGPYDLRQAGRARTRSRRQQTAVNVRGQARVTDPPAHNLPPGPNFIFAQPPLPPAVPNLGLAPVIQTAAIAPVPQASAAPAPQPDPLADPNVDHYPPLFMPRFPWSAVNDVPPAQPGDDDQNAQSVWLQGGFFAPLTWSSNDQWIGTKFIGSGSYGSVGLWQAQKANSDGNITDVSFPSFIFQKCLDLTPQTGSCRQRHDGKHISVDQQH